MLSLLHFLITPALAETTAPVAAAAPAANAGVSLGGLADMLGPQAIVFMVILTLFYVLMIRPQQQQMDTHKAMLKKLQKGDQIVTGGGIIGTVVKVDGDEHISIDISNGVTIKIVRSTISHVLKTPATDIAKS